MITLAFFFKSAAVTALIFLIIGLIQPWWVLWWEATQHRLKVIRVYGTLAVVCALIAYLITLIS